MSSRFSLVLSELDKKDPLPQPPPAASHHVVSVEAPTLPKRRAGLCVVVCTLCWIASTVALSVGAVAAGRSLWGGESVAASFVLSRIRAVDEPCYLRVFAAECDVTRLQLHVSLGMLLQGIVNEDTLAVEGADGEFRVHLDRCGSALADALSSEGVVAAWKAKLAPLQRCALFVANARSAQPDGRRAAQDAQTEERGEPPPPTAARVGVARGAVPRGGRGERVRSKSATGGSAEGGFEKRVI